MRLAAVALSVESPNQTLDSDGAIAAPLGEPVHHQREICIRCNRSRASCFCGFVTPFATRSRFVLLMHVREFKNQKTGTGRMVREALENSEIIMGIDFTHNNRLNELLRDSRYFPVVLFPGNGSVNLSTIGEFNIPASKELLVLVIDGTWKKAKKIMYLSKNLQPLQKVCFTPPSLSRFSFKRQPAPHCVSTIEAVHDLLDQFDRMHYEQLEGRHATLIKAIEKLVVFQEKFIPRP